jgi:chromosome segregation ATPase
LDKVKHEHLSGAAIMPQEPNDLNGDADFDSITTEDGEVHLGGEVGGDVDGAEGSSDSAQVSYSRLADTEVEEASQSEYVKNLERKLRNVEGTKSNLEDYSKQIETQMDDTLKAHTEGENAREADYRQLELRMEAREADYRQLQMQMTNMQKARTEHDDAVEVDHRKTLKELEKQCKQQSEKALAEQKKEMEADKENAMKNQIKNTKVINIIHKYY